MTLKSLNNEIENAKKLPETSTRKPSLADKLKELNGVISRYEQDGVIHKEDKEKVETLKDFITDLVKQDDKREN